MEVTDLSTIILRGSLRPRDGEQVPLQSTLPHRDSGRATRVLRVFLSPVLSDIPLSPGYSDLHGSHPQGLCPEEGLGLTGWQTAPTAGSIIHHPYR